MPDILKPDQSNSARSSRLRDLENGIFAQEVAIAAAAPLRELLRNTTLIAGSGNFTSGWFDLSDVENLIAIRNSASGAYALEIDWSSDAAVVDIVETIVLNNNSRIVIPVATEFARIRIRNTDAALAFTAHTTVVNGR